MVKVAYVPQGEGVRVTGQLVKRATVNLHRCFLNDRHLYFGVFSLRRRPTRFKGVFRHVKVDVVVKASYPGDFFIRLSVLRAKVTRCRHSRPSIARQGHFDPGLDKFIVPRFVFLYNDLRMEAYPWRPPRCPFCFRVSL